MQIDLSKVDNLLLVPSINDVDIYGRQGKTWDFNIQFYQDPQQTQPVDLTGLTPQAEIKYNVKDSASVVAAFVCTIPIPSNGVVFLHLDPATTIALQSAGTIPNIQSTYNYELVLYTVDLASVYYGLSGQIFIIPRLINEPGYSGYSGT